MRIETIRLFQFRNLQDQTIQIPPGEVLIVGQNGTGKTNLAEAIYLLGAGKSFRTSDLSELIRIDSNETSVFANCQTEHGEMELGVSLHKKRRTLFVNQKQMPSLIEYLGHLPCVSFTPNDLALVKGPALGRRRFADKHLCDLSPGILRALMEYQRALKSKSEILKHMATRTEIETWNGILARAGTQIINSRLSFLQELESRAKVIHQAFAPEDGLISLAWESGTKIREESNEAQLLDSLNSVIEREIGAKRVLAGPHRDDIRIILSGKDARSFASQGQSRSIAIALKLAAIEMIEKKLGDSPIVILDDVDSELDALRSERLFSHVFQEKRQIFLTGTKKPAGSSKNSVVFSVTNGLITPF